MAFSSLLGERLARKLVRWLFASRLRARALCLVRRFGGGPSHEFYVSNLPYKMTVVELRTA
jgi:hypothetical protein